MAFHQACTTNRNHGQLVGPGLFAAAGNSATFRLEDFLYWLAADRKMAVRITRLIGEVQRDPSAGIGKPEPLKGDLSGYWSRRIDDEHRLVYPWVPQLSGVSGRWMG